MRGSGVGSVKSETGRTVSAREQGASPLRADAVNARRLP